MPLTIPDDLDEPRQVMYEELVEQHGVEALETDLAQAVHTRITNLYDNQGNSSSQA